MTNQSPKLKARLAILNAVMKKDKLTIPDEVKTALETHNGDSKAVLDSLKDTLEQPTFDKLSFAHSLAVLSDDNLPIIKALVKQDVKNLRDVALKFDAGDFVKMLDVDDISASSTPGEKSEEKAANYAYAASLHNKLFASETSAVLQHMVQTVKLPIADAGVREGLVNFLNNQPKFDIRKESIYTALKNEDAFKGITDEQRPGVIEHLKTLQRVQAISPTAEAVPILMKANLTSSMLITAMPEAAFIKRFASSLGEENAKLAYTNATNLHIRNEHALTTMLGTVRGAGLAAMDGPTTRSERLTHLQRLTDEQKIPLNLENLFGDMDYCECDDCTSVYSPAAYFVELLQYLRNNNLDPENINTGHKGIANTPLEKLFRRRPDLGCLELTCENTDTVLPYVDLVNEVMESFVVHLNEYKNDPHNPKQAKLEVFNVVDETSGELLAQPQHTNYEAYCILKNAVYPFTLPYHQPIDEARIFLKYLGTSRYELLHRFHAAPEKPELANLHTETLDRADDAEFLNLTQEEYKILTKEIFWPKAYFDKVDNRTYSKQEYQQKIGVKDVWVYYGYDTELQMLDMDETQKLGLTFVKNQFLRRTGIQYTDLVELLKTHWINPNYPQGKTLNILESIRFSYRFLQSLVDTSSKEPTTRFEKLIKFLEAAQPFVPLVNAMLHPDPCQEQKPDFQLETQDLRHWVYCNFEKIGQLIVLESGEGPQLPIEGSLWREQTQNTPETQIGILHKDGKITSKNGTVIGNVNILGLVVWADGKAFALAYNTNYLKIKDSSKKQIGRITASGIYNMHEDRFFWLPAQDSCDLDKVRLLHLNGTPLKGEEYDCIQRFIRLWRKLGWTIDETDKALTGLAMSSPSAQARLEASLTRVDLDDCNDDCDDPETTDDDCGCSDPQTSESANCEITPQFLHQLVAIKKLLDLTGLPLPKLLTFWSEISTAGEKSLYARLFLTHNLLGIDKIFKADVNGNYLTQPAKLLDHLPILMAALNLKADDVDALIKDNHLDELTLPNVSNLYRHSLLAKTLHIKAADLPDLKELFSNPFENAAQTLELFETWGKMDDAGFTFRQLAYVIRNRDDSLRPLTPTKQASLKLRKTLFDGLNTIDRDHPDVSEDKKDETTTELVRAKAGLLFDQPIVEQIVGLLEGATVYTTNAPANQDIKIPDALKKKIKYSDPKDANPRRATIQITGILTSTEQTQARTLCIHPGWGEALDRVGKQTKNFYDDVLFGIFLNQVDAKIELLAPDISITDDQQDIALSDPNTAPKKRFYFLKYFMPFLRRQLTHNFIVTTVSGVVGLANDVTDLLLSEILVVGIPSQLAITALESIKTKPAGTTSNWKGYLIPPADDAYTFVAISETEPAALVLDGKSIPFKYRQEDPNDVWSTDPTPKLKRGNLYKFEVNDQPVEQLQWKTAASSKVTIPTSAVLPDSTPQDGTEDVLIMLKKVALIVNGFGLSADEVSYWYTHKSDFGGFDPNAITLPNWKRLQAYTDLRNNLPKAETTLLDLFKWAIQPDSTPLNEKIALVTGWKKENIEKLLATNHFDINKPEAFRNEVNLVKLHKSLQVADKIGVDIDRLFEWAKPGSKFWKCHQIAEDIRKATRARFNQEDWEQAIRPLNDQLRENQKQALISYLLVQPALIAWPVVDADSLFEFFLIDVQMDPCMETSRMKQAISSVQLFIQRCLFGLEEKYGVPNNVLDRDRWEWMQRYRVWEANRKVFLYAENWIEPNLRDDKSPFYKELESELLQKDINKQTVEDALKSYLFKVDEVANLKVVGLFLEQDLDKNGNLAVDSEKNPIYIKLHVFARTRNAPYFFYYRYFNVKESNWYAWEKVQVDIPSYDVEDADGKITENGTYLIPVVWNRRLLIFFPQFIKKTKPNENTAGKAFSDMASDSPNNSKPTEYWEIKMAWSEYRNGKWTQKQLSTDAIYDFPEPTPAVPGATLSSIVNAVRETKDASKAADDTATIAKNRANDAKAATEISKNSTNSAAVEIPILVPGGLLALPAIIPILTNLNDKAAAAKDSASTANTEAGNAKTAASAALNKANAAVTAVEKFDAASRSVPNSIGRISSYEFIPRIVANSNAKVVIDVYRDNPAIGAFHFAGSQLSANAALVTPKDILITTSFHYDLGQNPIRISSLQGENQTKPALYNQEPYFGMTATETVVQENAVALKFYHPFAHKLLGKLMAGNLDNLFSYYLNLTGQANKDDAFGADVKATYHELKRPYSLYNWEAAFHTPMALVNSLLKSQQFEQAIKMCHYVFNPLAEGTDEKRFWQFIPFKEIDAKNVLEKLFASLQPNQPDDQINEWRDKPFQPHVIARSRPSAYMKWVVVKYIEILVAWGDYLFRQDTIESINQATQLYVLAAHIYGPRGQKIPKRGKTQPQTYNSLLDQWDAFGNAMTELELVFPFSNQTPFPIGIGNGTVGLANVFGFATSLYFCIPDNPKLKALRDTIDDRLFKIRHCENIEGIFRKLPLFEPPIDPSLLVQAAAQGLSLSSVLNDLNSPMPNYRFYYLLQKALELCSELKALGNTFLSLKEKSDGEALSQMRARHESSMHNLVMEVKKQQLEEATKSLEALQQSRKGPAYRLQHFLKLIGEDLGKVPTDNTDFSELPNQIEQPIDESGLKLIHYEKEEMDKAHEAANKQNDIGSIEVLASILNIIPNFSIDFKPIGIGAGMSFGGSNLGSAAQAVARSNQIIAANLTYQSTSAGRKGGFLRQLQDRVEQANVAGYEIKNIDKQVLTQQIRISIANLEITNQQKQIDNAQEVEEFLRNKYTNQELYVWMEDQIRTLYYQAYTLAYELAKKAEKVFRFERGLTSSNFIQFGYWNAAYDGLLSGENLYIALKQLEAAYQEKRGYDYEISKPISLRQIDPMALLQLREIGSCEFSLPEVLFDMDHPGHYMRRIKSVALTVPCVVGPYTSLNCTLRLLEHTFRVSALASASNYARKTDESDDRFNTTNIPISSIAVSTGQNDSGVFDLNFRDERYIPFEGAGVISKWRIELPDAFRQFDYGTISDVILQVRYTSVEGGGNLKSAATKSVQNYINAVTELSQHDGLFAVFDLTHDFPSEWYQAMHPAVNVTERIIVLNNLSDRLPIFVKGKNIVATDIYVFTPANLSMSIEQGANNEDFTGSPDLVEKLKSYSVKNEFPVTNWQLKIKDTATAIEKLWLVFKYKI